MAGERSLFKRVRVLIPLSPKGSYKIAFEYEEVLSMASNLIIYY